MMRTGFVGQEAGGDAGWAAAAALNPKAASPTTHLWSIIFSLPGGL
jgi:hypothetical protein